MSEANEPQKPVVEETRAPSAKKKKEPQENVPAGCAACFVAIPNKVSNGKGADAKPGERVIGPEKSIDRLELLGLAFRDENEAKAAFAGYKRKLESEIQAKLEAAQRREENRERWRKELAMAEVDGLEWTS